MGDGIRRETKGYKVTLLRTQRAEPRKLTHRDLLARETSLKSRASRWRSGCSWSTEKTRSSCSIAWGPITVTSGICSSLSVLWSRFATITAQPMKTLDWIPPLAEGQAFFQPYASLPALHFAHNAVAVEPQGDWFRNFECAEGRKRGLDFHEDIYNPCVLRFDLSQTGRATVMASRWNRVTPTPPPLTSWVSGNVEGRSSKESTMIPPANSLRPPISLSSPWIRPQHHRRISLVC